MCEESCFTQLGISVESRVPSSNTASVIDHTATTAIVSVDLYDIINNICRHVTVSTYSMYVLPMMK